jgi:hypothetical protein
LVFIVQQSKSQNTRNTSRARTGKSSHFELRPDRSVFGLILRQPPSAFDISGGDRLLAAIEVEAAAGPAGAFYLKMLTPADP